MLNIFGSTGLKAAYGSVKWWVIGCALQGHPLALGFLLAAPLQFLAERYGATADLVQQLSSMTSLKRLATHSMRNCFAVAPAIQRQNYFFFRRPPC